MELEKKNLEGGLLFIPLLTILAENPYFNFLYYRIKSSVISFYLYNFIFCIIFRFLGQNHFPLILGYHLIFNRIYIF